MLTPEQYRAKATEYGDLAKTSAGSDQKHDLQQRQQSFTTLADNEQWLADNQQNTVHAADKNSVRAAEPARHTDVAGADEEGHVLRCLGAALIMQWNTLPTKLQRELFDNAGSMGPLLETPALRSQIARFLHTHKNGEEAAK
jgi:hypothetical protein